MTREFEINDILNAVNNISKIERKKGEIIEIKNDSADKMDVLNESDALILLTEWPEFRSPDFKKIKAKLKTPILFDGRNQFDKNDLNKLGIEYHQIGVQ